MRPCVYQIATGRYGAYFAAIFIDGRFFLYKRHMINTCTWLYFLIASRAGKRALHTSEPFPAKTNNNIYSVRLSRWIHTFHSSVNGQLKTSVNSISRIISSATHTLALRSTTKFIYVSIPKVARLSLASTCQLKSTLLATMLTVKFRLKSVHIFPVD